MKEECGKYDEVIQLYLDGRLPEGERPELERHIESCASCRTEMENYSILFSGLENMPLDEPAADFNAAVLARIPFPAKKPARARWSLLGIRPGIPLALGFAMMVASFGLYQVVLNSARITSFLSDSFLNALNATEWMGMISIRGLVNAVKLATDLPILRSLALVGKVLLNAATTTVSDPFVALMLSAMTVIGIVATVMLARIMRPGWRHASANGAEIPSIMHF